jgi:hypothetical protein
VGLFEDDLFMLGISGHMGTSCLTPLLAIWNVKWLTSPEQKDRPIAVMVIKFRLSVARRFSADTP